jgi:hypothetical protein
MPHLVLTRRHRLLIAGRRNCSSNNNGSFLFVIYDDCFLSAAPAHATSQRVPCCKQVGCIRSHASCLLRYVKQQKANVASRLILLLLLQLMPTDQQQKPIDSPTFDTLYAVHCNRNIKRK